MGNSHWIGEVVTEYAEVFIIMTPLLVGVCLCLCCWNCTADQYSTGFTSVRTFEHGIRGPGNVLIQSMGHHTEVNKKRGFQVLKPTLSVESHHEHYDAPHMAGPSGSNHKSKHWSR
eukprot:TCALIF_07174-PA protein Name:"Protein of unknown function" AED:0.73 eAED:0.74 QI:0/0/0.33/0.66/0.5/0.66/3/0/115